MGSDADKSKLTAWERWELASFDGSSTKLRAQEPKDLPPTPEEIQQIMQQAQQEGYVAGHAQGEQAGYTAGQAKAQAEGERMAAMVGQLDEALVGFDQQVAEDLLGLALEVARQVVRQAITVKPEVILEVIRETLAQMPHPHAVIHLHPEDASLARLYLGDQISHAGHRIHEDPRLQRADCMVEAAGSLLDASLATRWKRIAESLGAHSDWLDAEDEQAPP